MSGDHQGFYGDQAGVKLSSVKEVEQNFLPGFYLCPCKSPGIKMQTTQPSNVFPSSIVCLTGKKMHVFFSPTSDILKVIICHAHVLI